MQPQRTKVFKQLSPEEQQTLAELESLVSELKAMSMASQGMGLGQVPGGPASGLPGSVTAGQVAPGEQGQAPGYGGTDDDYNMDGELDGSGDDQTDPGQQDQTDPANPDDTDPDGAGDVDINARDKGKGGKPMNGNNFAHKAAQMAGVDGDKTITPASPATAPQGKGDDNWGEDGFDDPDNQGLPKAPPSGQDDGKSAMKAQKAALERELHRINKAIEATPHNGNDALDSADEKIGDLPAYDIEDVNDLSRTTGASPAAVEKMLQAMHARHAQKVQKSRESGRIRELENVVMKQQEMLGEVLEGIRSAAGVGPIPAAPQQRQVQKSRPVGTYPQGGGQDIVELIADAVVRKSGGGMRHVGGQSQWGDPELDSLLADSPTNGSNRGEDVHKSMGAFTELFGQSAQSMWGIR